MVHALLLSLASFHGHEILVILNYSTDFTSLVQIHIVYMMVLGSVKELCQSIENSAIY